MADSGRQVTPEQLPDWSKEWPDAQVRFPLRATPKPHVRIVPGASNNHGFRLSKLEIAEWPPLLVPGPEFRRLVRPGAGSQNPTNPQAVGRIASAEAFGTPRVILKRAILRPTGITTGEAFGSTLIGGILQPPQSPGEPADSGIRDEELFTAWIRSDDLFEVTTDSAVEPLYRVSIDNN